jgi:nucleotide-binding universal stress UspA family protein
MKVLVAVSDGEKRIGLGEADDAIDRLRQAGQCGGRRPATVITATARSDGYDLIVVGTKGRSQYADILIGSVAQRVASTADVPVLLVPTEAGAA